MTGAVQVLVQFEGVGAIPLADCEWVWFEACGCAFACSRADTADEETAWRDMFHYAYQRAAHRKRGVTAELVTKDRFRLEIAPMMRLDWKCPHKESA